MGTQILDLWIILYSEFSFLRRDNSYFQFHRIPILMRYPITARATRRPGFLKIIFSFHFTKIAAAGKGEIGEAWL
ncbi:hypothetical protein IX84_31880 [Phaeodactylibacter xiamenensis]|uniref:Uncharacterized protein n=1 Tax=Phaeodactylibacter xiamenensis TaxID=1524460 RepID=A0A098RX59_9BACT|nr:hypothetical protein IX84_31880 [Phaeodactylibacter xiamenensis]